MQAPADDPQCVAGAKFVGGCVANHHAGSRSDPPIPEAELQSMLAPGTSPNDRFHASVILARRAPEKNAHHRFVSTAQSALREVTAQGIELSPADREMAAETVYEVDSEWIASVWPGGGQSRCGDTNFDDFWGARDWAGVPGETSLVARWRGLAESAKLRFDTDVNLYHSPLWSAVSTARVGHLLWEMAEELGRCNSSDVPLLTAVEAALPLVQRQALVQEREQSFVRFRAVVIEQFELRSFVAYAPAVALANAYDLSHPLLNEARIHASALRRSLGEEKARGALALETDMTDPRHLRRLAAVIDAIAPLP